MYVSDVKQMSHTSPHYLQHGNALILISPSVAAPLAQLVDVAKLNTEISKTLTRIS